MTTIIGGKTSNLEKIMGIILALVFIAFLISIPFMIADKQQQLEQQWQTQGCKMYDTDKVQDIPSKCNNDFVDKYKPQTQRVQPPEESL